LFIFKARLKAHSGLCNRSRNTEDGQKDKQDGILFTSKSLTLKVQKSEKTAPLKASLTRFQMQLLARVKEDPSISYDVLAEKLERNRTTLIRNIQKLKNVGALKRIGSKKTGYWEVIG
jgi:predicted HTH transcriptional regulator